MRDDHPAKNILTGLCAVGVLTPHSPGLTELRHPHGKIDRADRCAQCVGEGEREMILTDTTFLAAVVAAFGSLVVLVVSRHQKTSEFRQAWIDEQRKDLAELLALSGTIKGSTPLGGDELKQFDQAAYRVKLREKPRDQEWNEAINAIEMLRKSCIFPNPQVCVIQEHQKQIVFFSRIKLKEEWTKVKDGELPFKIIVNSLWAFSIFVAFVLLRYLVVWVFS